MTATSRSDEGTLRLLVVDDDSFLLTVLRKMLQRLGMHRVMTCTSAASALDRLSGEGPQVDVVMLDINMPDMDGIEFVRRLGESRYAGSIILISGEGQRMIETMEQLVLSHGLGLLGSMQKPPVADKLMRLLRKARVGTPAPEPRKPQPPGPTAGELAAAIEAGELINFYQPQVNLCTGEVIGVESLVRWRQKDGTLLGPERIIPLAEECGLISRITARVLRQAVAQVRTWSQNGIDLPVSVNVSMHDLRALDFPDVAEAIAAGAGVDPRRITLEITESRFMEQRRTTLDVIGRLKLRRFQLSIDDFGTGHSSLTQLKDLPFDEMKIDRGFVHGAATNDTRRAICSATLRMAAQLGMVVVAEGIERRDDQEMLVHMGCRAGQGYLFARPMLADDATGWMKSRLRDSGIRTS